MALAGCTLVMMPDDCNLPVLIVTHYASVDSMDTICFMFSGLHGVCLWYSLSVCLSRYWLEIHIDLCMDQHSAIVLCKLIWRLLDNESVKTLVHAFMTALVDDYCNMVLTSSPRFVTDKLQRVLNATAYLISGTCKYDRGLSPILCASLHWFSVADWVWYKLGVTVHQCLNNKVP